MRESEWLAALRQGDKSWFPELVDDYKDRIYALAYRRTRNPHDAEDLAQEIFLLFYRKLPLFRGDAALSTWLYRLALNCASSYSRKRRPLQLLENTPDLPDETSPDEQLLLDERQQAVLEAIARLRPHEREALELFYFQQQSMASTAEILGISTRGAETRLRRARERMKRLLDDSYFKEVTDCRGDEGFAKPQPSKPT